MMNDGAERMISPLSSDHNPAQYNNSSKGSSRFDDLA